MSGVEESREFKDTEVLRDDIFENRFLVLFLLSLGECASHADVPSQSDDSLTSRLTRSEEAQTASKLCVV